MNGSCYHGHLNRTHFYDGFEAFVPKQIDNLFVSDDHYPDGPETKRTDLYTNERPVSTCICSSRFIRLVSVRDVLNFLQFQISVTVLKKTPTNHLRPFGIINATADVCAFLNGKDNSPLLHWLLDSQLDLFSIKSCPISVCSTLNACSECFVTRQNPFHWEVFSIL